MKPIYVAFIDEVPQLSTIPHEVCEPEPLTSEEIVIMWDVLKTAFLKATKKVEAI